MIVPAVSAPVEIDPIWKLSSAINSRVAAGMESHSVPFTENSKFWPGSASARQTRQGSATVTGAWDAA